MNHAKRKYAWTWKRGGVDRSRHHLIITYAPADETSQRESLPVARVSAPENNCFTVEFLVTEKDPTARTAIDATIRELNFYLVEKGEKDPWAYALYHCSTAANLYSPVHWGASPGYIPDWNGKDIQICRSRGGVLATTHPFDNLIRPRWINWPPPEIVQKMYKSRQEGAFKDLDRQGAIYGLGYYCDLQSLHSEDAITWSVFGTLRYSSLGEREKWAGDFIQMLGLPKAVPEEAEISLWRRMPHPDSLVPGGPEIDFWISTKNAIILGESKWLSRVGAGQGKAKDSDQVKLRQKLLKEYGGRFFPGKSIQSVVGIGLSSTAFHNDSEGSAAFRSVRWDLVCGIPSHPEAAELKRYLVWKKAHMRDGPTHLE